MLRKELLNMLVVNDTTPKDDVGSGGVLGLLVVDELASGSVGMMSLKVKDTKKSTWSLG